MIRPIPDQSPFTGFEAEMIEAIGIRSKHRQAVVFIATPQKCSSQYSDVIDDAVRQTKPDDISVEGQEPLGIGTGEYDMLQTRCPRPDSFRERRVRSWSPDPEDELIPIRIAETHGAGLQSLEIGSRHNDPGGAQASLETV
jgi:hypothetical protein